MKKTVSFSLHPDETVSIGVPRILASVGKAIRESGKSQGNASPESIHALRVLIKRLRALLWFLYPVLTDEDYARVKSLLKKAADNLAQSRDLAVIQSVFNQAALSEVGEKKRLAASRASHAVSSHESDPSAGEVTPQLLEKTAELILQAIRAIHDVTTSKTNLLSSTKRIKKALGATRKAAVAALKKEDPTLLHEWRKKTKRLLYGLELVQHQPKQKWAGQIEKIDELQQALGDYHDTIVAEKHLADHHSEFLDETDMARAQSVLEKKRKLLLKKTRHLWKAILKNL